MLAEPLGRLCCLKVAVHALQAGVLPRILLMSIGREANEFRDVGLNMNLDPNLC